MDLRLLSIFDEVYKTRSVSRAAENLDIPQTSVSLALGRLRRQFNDPLFVRTSEGMVPTPHASELLVPLRQALELLVKCPDAGRVAANLRGILGSVPPGNRLAVDVDPR